MIKPIQDGNGIRVTGCTASCFGGTDDKEDNGKGFFGFEYRDYPDFPGCAMPVRCSIPSLRNSPLPMVPHYQPVHIYNPATNKAVWAVFVDIGPTGTLDNGNRGIDLNPAAFRALGVDPSVGLIENVTYFIPNVKL